MSHADQDKLDWTALIKKELDKLNDYVTVDTDQHWDIFVQNLQAKS